MKKSPEKLHVMTRCFIWRLWTNCSPLYPLNLPPPPPHPHTHNRETREEVRNVQMPSSSQGRPPGRPLVSALSLGIKWINSTHHQRCRIVEKKIQNLKDDGQRKNKGSQSRTLVRYIKTTYLNKELWNISYRWGSPFWGLVLAQLCQHV